MDAKKVGIIALVIIAVGVLIFSFKGSFMNSAAPAGHDAAMKMKASMEAATQAAQAKRAAGQKSTGMSGGQ